jgi:hypothetical protein
LGRIAMKLLDLPNEILVKIFSNLNQKELLHVSLVSKKVKELAFNPVLWTELKFGHRSHREEDTRNLEKCQGRDSPILHTSFNIWHDVI